MFTVSKPIDEDLTDCDSFLPFQSDLVAPTRCFIFMSHLDRRSAASTEDDKGIEVEVHGIREAELDGEVSNTANPLSLCFGENPYQIVGVDDDDTKKPWLANLYALPNWALCLSYFNVGIALMFLSTPVSYIGFCSAFTKALSIFPYPSFFSSVPGILLPCG